VKHPEHGHFLVLIAFRRGKGNPVPEYIKTDAETWDFMATATLRVIALPPALPRDRENFDDLSKCIGYSGVKIVILAEGEVTTSAYRPKRHDEPALPEGSVRQDAPRTARSHRGGQVWGDTSRMGTQLNPCNEHLRRERSRQDNFLRDGHIWLRHVSSFRNGGSGA
jgi:hypothetical protein